MMHGTFLSYRSFRWLWLSLLLVAACSTWYVIDVPTAPRSGSTPVGYFLGIVCGGLMAYLMWYGVRKRSYSARLTNMRGVLSAHVWLGSILLLLVPLHCGFRFHFNLHTICYVVMSATVISGIWGAYFYRALPRLIHSNRGGSTIRTLMDQFEGINRELRSIEVNRSDALTGFVTKLDTYSIPSLYRTLTGFTAKPLEKNIATELLRSLPEAEREAGISVVSLLQKKFEFTSAIERESRTQWLLKLWLFFHLPLAVGSVILLIIHILSVLFYRS